MALIQLVVCVKMCVELNNSQLFLYAYPLKIKGRFFVFEAEPRFLHLSKMKKKSIPRPVGSSIRFRCRASGNPRPEIQWLKDGQMWTSDNMGNYQDSRLRWTLKIDDLRQEDSGQYTCVVTNIHGTINYTYSLEVVGK